MLRAEESGEVPDALSTLLGPSPDLLLLEDRSAALTRLVFDTDSPDVPRAAALLLTRQVALTTNPVALVSALSDLALVHREAHRLGCGQAHLDHAVSAAERSVLVVEAPERHVLLSNLGLVLLTRGHPRDLDRAVEVATELLDVHPDLAAARSGLCRAHTARAREAHRHEDADAAIEHGGLAVAEAPENPLFLHRLAEARFERYLLRRKPHDVEAAVALGTRAARRATPGIFGGVVSALGVFHLYRYRLTRSREDLDQAVDYARMAVEAGGSGARAGSLSTVLQERHERTGAPADLDEALARGHDAVAATALDDPSLLDRLSGLGAAYQLRYDRDGALEDLHTSVELGERASATGQAAALSNLSLARWKLYLREDQRPHLDGAVAGFERAVAAARPDDPDLAAVRGNLAMALLRRFTDARDAADLERAEAVAVAAVHSVGDDDRDLPNHLSTLANVRLEHFNRSGSRVVLAEALTDFRRAVELTPAGHPRAALRWSNLANALLRGVELAGQPVEADELARVLTEAERLLPRLHEAAHADGPEAGDACPPTDLVRLGHRAGALAHAVEAEEADARACGLLDRAVEHLVSVVAVAGRRRVDQEHWLGENRSLVVDAVAAHCALGDAGGALAVAEAGRGVLLGAQHDARAGVGNPLLERLGDVGERLNRAADPVERARLRAEHRALLTDAKADEGGWSGGAVSAETVRGGAAVLLNSGSRRGDAVVVREGEPPLLVPLPLLRRSEVERRAEALLGATYDRSELSGGGGPVVAGVLEWLWESVVGPLLESTPLDRVWWLPTGPLGLFPLHAAGVAGGDNALDLLTSSYTPTLRVLARTRARPPVRERSVLGVAVGAGLPHSGVVKIADLPLVGRAATAARVLAELPAFTQAYFTCHADVDLVSPSLGALHLHDGDLSVSEIARHDLGRAGLAFLAACSGGHRGVRHTDESIHPASAFQVAGFRHVVSGMWPLKVAVAKHVMRRFHALSADRPDEAANVLREVVRDLRDTRYADHPAAWAPFIHSGP
ncbi:CHAT domain-containing protein [Actinosynnema pretiosum]|nr:CHAT domain-containing protein [Actinosynnema pretiosum]